MSYTSADHAEDKADLLEDSVPVIFSADVPAVDAAGNQTGGVTTRNVVVHCMDNYDGGSPEMRNRIALGESAGPALFGIPDVFGEEPDAGMECEWGGKRYTVRSVAPFAPQGTTAMMVIGLQR